jgi:hypothetical protein
LRCQKLRAAKAVRKLSLASSRINFRLKSSFNDYTKLA